jgi:hypothetical protein
LTAGGEQVAKPSEERRPRQKRAWRDFKRGLHNQNPLVLVAALVLLAGALAGIQLFFTSGAYTAIPEKYLLRRASDDYMYVSYTMSSLLRHPPKVPVVYLLGGSTARESITSGTGLAAEIKQDGGPAVQAYDLGSINQNYGQDVAIVDNAPKIPSILLIGVNVGRYTPSPGASMMQTGGRELLLSSPSLRTYVYHNYHKRRWSITILPGIMNYLVTYAHDHRHQLLHLQIPDHPYNQHRYNLHSIHSVKAKQTMVKIWNKTRWPLFKRNFAFNTAMLEELIKVTQARGLTPVLLELPNNQEIVGHAFDTPKAMYRATLTEFAQKYNIDYIDFNDQLHIPNADFHDLSHLVEPGRVIWQKKLAQVLTQLLAKYHMGGGGT